MSRNSERSGTKTKKAYVNGQLMKFTSWRGREYGRARKKTR